MKTSLKIIILILFVVVAVGAVLIFVKTQLAPPANIKYNDPYSKSLNADVEKVSVTPYPNCNDDYVKAYHKIKFMRGEELLNDEQTDDLIVKVDTAMGNRVVEYAYRIFNTTSWPDAELQRVSSMMEGLKGDQLSTGQRAITYETEDSFREVEGVMRDYRDAQAFARNTSFRSVADATDRVNSIEDYRSKPYLANNAALMTALDNLPGAINASHYNLLAGVVNRLGGYRNMTADDYEELVQRVETALTEYENAGYVGRSTKKDISALKKREVQLIDAAYEYYYRNNEI